MMSESFVEQQEQEQQCIYLCIYLVLLVAIVYGGGICRVKSYFFFTSKSFLNGSRCVSFVCDLFCRIPDISDLEAICERNDLITHLMDHPGDWTPVIADWVLHLVTRGLGKRVEMLCYKPQTSYQVGQNT